MAEPRQNQPGNVSQSVAEDTVFENLGLDREELGIVDEPDDIEPDQDTGPDDQEPELDFDSGVTHTRDQEQQPKRPLPRRSEVKDDGKGNLVNAKGEIVARGGVQSRLYQKAERARRQLTDAQAESTELRSRLTRLATVAKQLNDQVTVNNGMNAKLQEFGVTPQEQITAMQLFVELRDKPQDAIRRILTRAAANGINVAEIGQNGGFDAKSLADLVRGEVSKIVDPLRQRSDAQAQRERVEQERAQVNQRATEEVQAFFRRNPEAQPHAQVFARVLANPRYRDWSLGEIWARIMQNLPAGGGQRSRTPGTGSIPRGRGMPPGGNSKVADPNTSYDAIIKGVLAEAGTNRSR